MMISKKRLWWLVPFIVMVFTAAGMNAFAEPAWEGSITAQTFQIGLPTFEQPAFMNELPALTGEEKAKLEYWQENTNLPGPMPKGSKEAMYAGAPEPGTESVIANKVAVPGDASYYFRTKFGAKIPDGFKSNVMESSVAAAGKWVFFTGNWFAARTTKGGGTLKSQWQYVSSFTGFPDFCCDQVTIYDEARDRYFWLRMGSPSTNPGTGNYENVFKLSVSPDGFLNAWTYTISPLTIDPSWTDQWWDYAHIQLGANYMYLAWNMFNQAGNWTQTVMLKIDLDVLAAAGPFSGSYFAVTDWFTFVPVQGAYHSTYFASNWPTTAANVQGRDFRIYKWDEDSGTITFVTRQLAATFLPTDRNDAVCGGTSGNWCARYDMRVLTGARYSINSDPIDSARYPGRKVVGWWWNVAQGGGFALPYIDAAAFFEDTLTQVSGFAGRPYIWGADIYCFAYPSISPNKRQDLGGVFHYSEGPDWNPYIAFTIADDYTHAPPGWIFYEAQFSNARPSDNKWGDYNTVREYEPTQKVWAGASHYIQKVNDCTNCGEPIYFVFGRDRDWPSWRRWKGK